MDDITFANIVEDALKGLPEEFSLKLENVEVVIADWPSTYQLNRMGEGSKGLILGLYEGVPHTKRGNYGIGGQLPDKITIFKNPIVSISRDYEDAQRIIRNTVIHEIGHHFGLSDEEIYKAQIK